MEHVWLFTPNLNEHGNNEISGEISKKFADLYCFLVWTVTY